MSLVAGTAYTNSRLAAIDALHFNGRLAAVFSEFERFDAVGVNFTGSRRGEEIFIRSKFRSWAEHPALGDIVATLGDKGSAMAEALASAKSFRWLTSGSQRVFTTLPHPTHGRNTPTTAWRSTGLFDVDHWTASGETYGANYSLFGFDGSGAQRDRLKNVDVGAVVNRLRVFLRAPSATLMDQEAWDALDDQGRSAAEASGKRRATDEENEHLLWYRLSVTPLAPTATAGQVSAAVTPLVHFTGETYAVLKATASTGPNPYFVAGGVTVIESTVMMITSMFGTVPRSATVFKQWNGLLAFLDASLAELAEKGFSPTGVVQFTKSGPIVMQPQTFRWPDGTSITTNLHTSVFSHQPRHGTSAVVYSMSSSGIAFEVLGEHPNDLIVVAADHNAGSPRHGDEKVVCSAKSFLRGGAGTNSDIPTPGDLAWYFSTLDEPWHVGSPDPLATVEVRTIVPVTEASDTPTIVRLTRAVVDEISALGKPRYYLPLFAAMGGADVAYVVDETEFSGYELLSHRDVRLDAPAEVGLVDLDEMEELAPDDPVLFDPTGSDLGDPEEWTDDQLLIAAGRAAVTQSSLHVGTSLYLASVSADWIVRAASTGFGFYKPADASDLSSVKKFVEQFEGQNLAFAAYREPVRFPPKIVQQTDIYHEYKKAREEACKVNNFLSLSYDGKRTWGDAQAAVARVGSALVIYGLYSEPSLVTPVPGVDYTKITYTYVVGTAPAVLTRKVGTDAPTTVGKDGADTVFGEVSLGAKLNGITLTGLVSSWHTAGATAQLSEETARMASTARSAMRKSDPARATTGGASLSWDVSSYDVNGFPIIDKLLYQDALKAIITSVNQMARPGAAVKAMLERTGQALIAPSVVRGKKIIAERKLGEEFFTI